MRILLFICLIFSACSSSTVVIAPKGEQLPTQVSLLPVKLETELTREHVATIERAMASALRNRGYLVSESKLNTENTTTVVATITRLRRDTILAGHVNTISGRIQVLDQSKTILAESEHTETERGGLLFNSGQVLKGLVSEIDNIDGSKFDDWIENFAAGLIGTLPRASKARIDSSTLEPMISGIETTKKGHIHEICFDGNPGHNAVLTSQNLKFPLRELASGGRYCLALPNSLIKATGLSTGTLLLESPFGIRSQSQFSLDKAIASCSDLEVLSNREAGAITFSVTCGEEQNMCSQNGPCSEYAFRLYEEQENGAFRLVEEFGVSGFTRKLEPSHDRGSPQYRVFKVHEKEQLQKPVKLSSSEIRGSSS